jgi:P pilus assembly protein, porin PapC
MKRDRVPQPTFYITKLAVYLSLYGCIGQAFAENYFNPRFLSDDPSAVASLSNFEKGIEAPPGTYRVNIYVNDNFVTSKDVNFTINQDKNRLDPCLSYQQLLQLGLNGDAVKDVSKEHLTEQCFPFLDKN